MIDPIEKFKIADTVISIEAEGLQFPDGPSPFYTPFRTQEKPAITITFEKVKSLPKEPKKNEAIFESLPSWMLYSNKQGYRLDIRSFHTSKRDRVAFISKDFTKIKVQTNKTRWNFQTLLRPLLEIIFVNYLAPREGLLLHAAAIKDHQYGYMFVGHSGAGKTTTTQIWKNQVGDYSILGDERTIVRKINGKWYVFGTPWPGIGMIIQNQSSSLSHIFSIRHGKKNEFLEGSKALLFQEIFGQIFSSFWSAETLDQISSTCEKLITEVPSHQFAFVKNDSAAQFVKKLARENTSHKLEFTNTSFVETS